jgi:hypothetical protein
VNEDKPKPPQPLNYRRPERYADWKLSGPGYAIEAVVGFFASLAMLGMLYIILMGAADTANLRFIACGAVVATLAGVAIYLHGWRGWRGFTPGVLLGFGVSCLIGVGGVFYLCSHMKL